MCFEVPALVPPGAAANGDRSHDDDDDLGIMDIDEADNKGGTTSNLTLLVMYTFSFT